MGNKIHVGNGTFITIKSEDRVAIEWNAGRNVNYIELTPGTNVEYVALLAIDRVSEFFEAARTAKGDTFMFDYFGLYEETLISGSGFARTYTGPLFFKASPSEATFRLLEATMHKLASVGIVNDIDRKLKLGPAFGVSASAGIIRTDSDQFMSYIVTDYNSRPVCYILNDRIEDAYRVIFELLEDYYNIHLNGELDDYEVDLETKLSDADRARGLTHTLATVICHGSDYRHEKLYSSSTVAIFCTSADYRGWIVFDDKSL